MGVVEPGIVSIERELTGALGAWAAGSIVVGTALGIVGRAIDAPVVSGFARQQVGWGAIDGVIAAVGAVRARGNGPDSITIVDDQDGPSDAERERAQRLHRLLKLNAVLDVGYVATGIAVAAAAAPLARRTGRDRHLLIGDGLGTVVQGGYLLALDAFFAHRVGRFLAIGR